jgi:acetyl-CoA carboxylase carboxyltransferase component
MSAGAAVEIIHHRQLRAAEPGRNTAEQLAGRYAEQHLSANAALRRGAIDAVIEPYETRRRVADVLLWSRKASRQDRP